MGKKIDGLVKISSSKTTYATRSEYEYKGVSVSRYYHEGTVGRVGVRRGGARYSTAGWQNTFGITNYNEVRGQYSYTSTSSTLKEAIQKIDQYLSEENVEVIRRRIYCGFLPEQLEKLR